MDIKEYIDTLLATPNTRISREYTGNTDKKIYYLRDNLQYKEVFKSIDGDINCYLRDTRTGPSGCVSLDINIDDMRRGEAVHFNDLLVPSRIENNGVGKYLMLTAINYVKNAKSYFGVNNTVPLRGWLSSFDAENGNWRTSLPLYDKVGEIAGVEHFFEAHDGNRTRYSAPAMFYSNASKIGGAIVYMI